MTGQPIPSLTEKLQARQREQLDAAAALTQQQLTQLAATLRQQCESALSTTDNVISAQRRQLSELQTEATTTAEALQRTLNAARSLELSNSDQHQIRERLMGQIKAEQQQVISQAIKPLRVALNSLNSEAQALSRTTAKSWLKPLLIGGAVLTGILLVAAGGTLTLDKLISSRLVALSEVQSQVREARATLAKLPHGVEFIQDRAGNRFITAPTLGQPFSHQGRQYVQIED